MQRDIYLNTISVLTSALSFLQALPGITSVMWDESHVLLIVYISVPLQGYGVYLGHGLIFAVMYRRGRQFLNFTKEICMLHCNVPVSYYSFTQQPGKEHLYEYFLQTVIDKY